MMDEVVGDKKWIADDVAGLNIECRTIDIVGFRQTELVDEVVEAFAIKHLIEIDNWDRFAKKANAHSARE